jgi:hypothetical protein
MAVLAVALVSSPAIGQRADTAITFTNQDGVARRFTIADLRALPQIEVKTEGNDGAVMVERGPLRIVIGAESHRARWIRHLASLRLVRVG